MKFKGAVDEDIFRKAFEDVPEIQIYSSRDLVENLNSIKDIISDPNKEWNKRVDAVLIQLKTCNFLILRQTLTLFSLKNCGRC